MNRAELNKAIIYAAEIVRQDAVFGAFGIQAP